MEYNINEYITLKLEGGNTQIYIDGKQFNQCKSLLLNIPIRDIPKYDIIDSIDEAAEYLSSEHGVGFDEESFTPEIEFWGHCSNIQAWVENDYDTRLLHRNIAFPLLKKLTDVGDPIAKRVFKEEIVKRLCCNYQPVVEYLLVEHYLQYLGFEEIDVILNDPIFQEFKTVDFSELALEAIPASIGNLKKVESLNLSHNSLEHLPESFSNLSSLKKLDISYNKFQEFPKILLKLENLEALDIQNNLLTEISEELVELRNLKRINIKHNPLEYIPEKVLEFQYGVKIEQCKILLELEKIIMRDLDNYEISNKEIISLSLESCGLEEFPLLITELNTLRSLNLGTNNLKSIPEDLHKLSNLKNLTINYNLKLRVLPEALWDLKSLQYLSLMWNDLREISDKLGNLTELRVLVLKYNWLEFLPETIGKLTNLVSLDLYGNNMKSLPRSMEKLKALAKLDLTKNLLEELPDFLSKLNNLKEISIGYNKTNRIPKSLQHLLN